jgi:menaquinone-specific isochorismate synthase
MSASTSISLDLIQTFTETNYFPKFFWSNREGSIRIAAFGIESQKDTFPKIQQNQIWLAVIPFSNHQKCDNLWNDWTIGRYILPELLLIEKNGTLYEQGNIDILRNSAKRSTSSSFSLQHIKTIPSFDCWQQNFQMRTDNFQKVVLGRRSDFITSAHHHQVLFSEKVGSYRFSIEPSQDTAFFGTSPERLYYREKEALFCEALAGTRKRTNDPKLDTLAIDSLQKANKDRKEFDFVLQFIKEQFDMMTHSYQISKREIFSTPRLYHLHQRIQGKLIRNTTDADILSLLHPTPAVCGLPRKEAFSFISKHEPFERGMYAGVFGFFTDDFAEMTVTIRSALKKGKHLHTFVGAGIVDESDVFLEWDELCMKEQSILETLYAYK